MVRNIISTVFSKKMNMTYIYCLAYCALGYILAGLGPSLQELGKRTGNSENMDRMGWVVTTRAIGYLVGSGMYIYIYFLRNIPNSYFYFC